MPPHNTRWLYNWIRGRIEARLERLAGGHVGREMEVPPGRGRCIMDTALRSTHRCNFDLQPAWTPGAFVLLLHARFANCTRSVIARAARGQRVDPANGTFRVHMFSSACLELLQLEDFSTRLVRVAWYR